MSALHPEVVRVVALLQSALGLSEALTTEGPTKAWPDHYEAQPVLQRWEAGPISVTTSGYGPDPSGYSGGEQVWIVSIASASFSFSMCLHDYAGWTNVALRKDPKSEPLLDALLAAGIPFGRPRESEG